MNRNKSGVLLERCRRCQEVVTGFHVPHLEYTLLALGNGWDLKTIPGNNGMLSAAGLHHCKDERIGITDVIGGKFDEE